MVGNKQWIRKDILEVMEQVISIHYCLKGTMYLSKNKVNLRKIDGWKFKIDQVSICFIQTRDIMYRIIQFIKERLCNI